MKKIITTIVIALMITSYGNSQENPKTKNTEKMELTNKEKAVALLNSLETGDHTPISYINPNKYIQHNLGIGDGLAGFGEVMKHAPEGGFKANVIRAFQDGDFVFTQTEYDFFGPKIGFDVFRFENGLIVEHWDNLMEVKPSNSSGHSQIDGATEIKDVTKTEVNKKFIDGFVKTIFIEGKMDQFGSYFDGNNYIQHNPEIGDGLSSLATAMQAMAKKGIKMEYHKVHKILGEGNFVLVISEGKFAGKPTSFYDLLRVENGIIAEHWDVIESIVPIAERKNANGKFNFYGTGLVGKQVKHQWTKGPWAGASFTTLFCNDSDLVWNNTSDPDKITFEKEKYVRRDIGDGVVQISWKEDPNRTNFGLIWTLDFNTNKIYGVIVNASPTENINVEGKFEVINSLEVEKGLTGCN
jgi:predicted SnoaL-like aldol condensation-catalyzing enzyme